MNRIKIGIDGDGGDNGGIEVVNGAINFSAKNINNVDVIIYTVAEKVDKIRARKDFPSNVAVVPTDGFIGPDFKPTGKDFLKNDTSLVTPIRMLGYSELDGVFSAGNTAAFIFASSVLVKKFSRDVKLALVSEFPNPSNPNSLGMDMGANPDISPEHIVNYALLGNAYFLARYGNQIPVGSLNIGTEDGKGMELHQATNKLLRLLGDEGILDYLGNLESDSFLSGDKKIIVGGAFDMNNALKSIKAGSDYNFGEIGRRFLGEYYGLKFASWLKKRVNKSGGALLLGANKPLAKANGNSSPDVVERTLEELYEYIMHNRYGKLIEVMNLEHGEMYEKSKSKIDSI